MFQPDNLTQDSITLGERMTAPKPKIFRTIRTIGLTLTALAGALLAAPVALPAIVLTIAGYVATAGTVAAVVSQSTVDYGALYDKKYAR